MEIELHYAHELKVWSKGTKKDISLSLRRLFALIKYDCATNDQPIFFFFFHY